MRKLRANQITFLENKYNVIIDGPTLTYTKQDQGYARLYKVRQWGPTKWFSVPREWIKEMNYGTN